jgi:hypothetical protein
MGNVLLLVLNLPLIGIWVRILKIPYPVLFPLILLFCIIGTYSLSNNLFDVFLLIFFGVIGYSVIGPANMDKRIVNILHDAFKKAMDSPIFVKTLEAMIIDPYYMSSGQYDRYMREGFPQFKEAVYMVGLEKKK